MPGGSGVPRWSPEVGGCEFQFLGCVLPLMWSRPASLNCLTSPHPAERVASASAAALGLVSLVERSRPCQTTRPTSTSTTAITPAVQAIVRLRRRRCASRRAAAPLTSLPLPAWAFFFDWPPCCFWDGPPDPLDPGFVLAALPGFCCSPMNDCLRGGWSAAADDGF